MKPASPVDLLPEVFPPGAELYDVEGIPVSIGAGVPPGLSLAWDVPSLRRFDPESARRNGAPVSEERFRQLVTSLHREP